MKLPLRVRGFEEKPYHAQFSKPARIRIAEREFSAIVDADGVFVAQAANPETAEKLVKTINALHLELQNIACYIWHDDAADNAMRWAQNRADWILHQVKEGKL